ncbi:MAG: lysine--tRNA ligase [bacterium]
MKQNTLSEIISGRYEHIKSLRASGIDPFPPRCRRTHTAEQARTSPAGTGVACAGRLMLIRTMGKAAFAHLQDGTGRIQVYLKKDFIGDAVYDFFKDNAHVGDFAGIKGSIFLTRTGEITINAESFTLLAKSVRPLPEKYHGLQDQEVRFRRRHLDLVSSSEVRKIFESRARIIRAVRHTLDSRGFLEVETPVLCSQSGGASAKPFETRHNALNAAMSLRIALELYLKRLIIGGYDSVYEIGKIFRNEGIDTRHNPEFTMLEAYQAYTDYTGMSELMESIVEACSKELGCATVEYEGMKIPLKPPFRRLCLPELWKEKCGEDIHGILDGKSFNRSGLTTLAGKLGIEHSPDTPSAKIFERIFDARILPLLETPSFVMDYPTAITPLAKCKPGDESLVERFEFFAGKEEIANAYTELNDPEDQKERLVEQLRQRRNEKNEDTDILDNDFVEAMEAGMPPMGGIGVGIDRLTMLLTGNPSIREVILFPVLKQQDHTASATEQTIGQSVS